MWRLWERRPCAREPGCTLPTDSTLVGMPFAPALAASVLELSWLAHVALYEPFGPPNPRRDPRRSTGVAPCEARVAYSEVTGGIERHIVSKVHPVPHHQ